MSVQLSVLLFGRLFVCTIFDSRADLWMDFFNFAHTHPLRGVDVPFEVYELSTT